MTTSPFCLRTLTAGLVLATALSGQSQLQLTGIGPGRGLVLHGEGGVTPSAPFMSSVGSLGAASVFVDLNGDGFDELVVGAPTLSFIPGTAGTDESGHVYVIFGGADSGNPGTTAVRNLQVEKCSTVLNLRGSPGDRAGASLASAGDLDGDGFDDLLIGVPGLDAPGRAACGGAYVLWGAADLADVPGTLAAPACAQNLVSWLGTRTTVLLGATAFGAAGTSVGGDVDADGDGTSDAVLGAPFASSGGHAQNGRATVVYGAASLKGSSTVDLALLGAGQATVVSGHQDFQLLGWAVAGLGAFDATLPDGLGTSLVAGDDIAIGAPGDATNGFFSGAVYTLRGVAGTAPASAYTSADFGNVAGSAGLVFAGAAAGDQAGSFVGCAGDLLAADGFVELVLDAPYSDPLGRQDAGTLYLVAGRLGGVDPTGFDLGDIGSGPLAIRFIGPGANAGTVGLFASGAGDFDQDGSADLALSLPGAAVPIGGVNQPQAGLVEILDGSQLQVPAVSSVDLAAVSGLRLILLTGDKPSDHAGSSLALGDINGDGFPDLSIGASGAASALVPGDLTGLVNAETGRGQLLLGPLVRPGALDPAVSHFDGPLVTLELLNVSDTSGLDVQIDGVSAVIEQVTLGSVATVVVRPPAPLAPGAGATVDIDIVLPGLDVPLPDAFTYTALQVIDGPTPNEVVPGFEIAFTGLGVSSDTDLSVTIGGVPATLVATDPLGGSFSVLAPVVPQPPFTPLDISIQSSNGDVLLQDAIQFRPFVILGLTPDSGPQDSGVFAAGLAFEGQPAVEVTLTMVTSSGTIPPETTVQFGSDALGWHEAQIVSAVGDQLVVELPSFFLFDETVVDVRVSTDLDTLDLEGAFTYEAGDFKELVGTELGAYGDPPRIRASGEFIPSATQLFVVDRYPPEIKAFYIVVGISQPDPPLFVNGGLLAVDPLFPLFFPPGLVAMFPGSFAVNLNTDVNLGPEGADIFLQVVTVEQVAAIKDFGFSNVLRLRVRFP